MGRRRWARINEILVEKPEIADGAGSESHGQGANAREFEGEIEFRNLNFAYNGKPVLHDVNLRIPAGSSLAIVGPTGSGKTTLVSLIPRIYDAAAGSVLIDGRPIREYSLEFLRANIGFIPQETFLFSESVRENIAFGKADATDAEVRSAAEAANIAEEIEGFPEKYRTLVGERGITLSGGQKQRTAIARAIIRNPRILILDDALSSVDTHTEDKILNHLREVMQGRTTIFISHRVSTVRNADMIAVLHSWPRGGTGYACGTDREETATTRTCITSNCWKKNWRKCSRATLRPQRGARSCGPFAGACFSMKRVVIPELLDSDAGTPSEIAASLSDLNRINRWFGGVATTQFLVERVAQAWASSRFRSWRWPPGPARCLPRSRRPWRTTGIQIENYLAGSGILSSEERESDGLSLAMLWHFPSPTAASIW